MKRAMESEELRKGLEQILELCLKTARDLQLALDELASVNRSQGEPNILR